MDDEDIIEREAHAGYTHCRKDNGTLPNNTIIMKLGKSFNKLFHSISFDNQRTPIPNVLVTGNLVFLIILVG